MSAADSLQILEQYSVVILPALVVAGQIGVPLPAVPALLAVGALAAHGRVSIPQVLAGITIAALAADFGRYELGRRRGAHVLGHARREARPGTDDRHAAARWGLRGRAHAIRPPHPQEQMTSRATVRFLRKHASAPAAHSTSHVLQTGDVSWVVLGGAA